jgi:hypothetical protein
VILLAVTVYHCLLSRNGRCAEDDQRSSEDVERAEGFYRQRQGTREPAGGARIRAQKMLDELKTKDVRNFNVA